MKRRWVAAAATLALCCLAVLCLGAQEEPQVGKFQAAAPDLITDTTTGRVVDSKGKVIQEAATAEPQEIGRYQAAGYVKVTPRVKAAPKGADWEVVSRTYTEFEAEKGLMLIDTTTGNVLANRVYSTETVKARSDTRTTPSPYQK